MHGAWTIVKPKPWSLWERVLPYRLTWFMGSEIPLSDQDRWLRDYYVVSRIYRLSFEAKTELYHVLLGKCVGTAPGQAAMEKYHSTVSPHR